MDHVIARAPLTSLEDRFRDRSLMLCTTATEDEDVADGDDNFFVASFHDASVDAQAHSEWPRPPDPGCYKRVASADTVPGLCSFGQGHTSYGCCPRGEGFRHRIGEEHPDFIRWCRNLVSCGRR